MRILEFLLGKKESYTLSDEQISIVQNSFVPVAKNQEKAGDLFYEYLFELDPTLQSLFNKDVNIQKRKFMNMLTALVSGLSDVDGMMPALLELGKKHRGFGVGIENYGTIGAALLSSLEKIIGKSWNEDQRQAWISVFTFLAVTMQTAGSKAA